MRKIIIRLFFSFLFMLVFIPYSTAAIKKTTPEGQKSGTTSTTASSATIGAPTREIQSIEKKMDAYNTGSSISAEQAAKNSQIKRDILRGTFDLYELCRLALDKTWSTLPETERANFVALMTDLLETKAIFSKEQTKTKNKSYTVQYLGDQFLDGSSKAITKTKVIVPKENARVDIEYKLRKSGIDWKIYDVIVDNASLVENYRFQFSSIINKSGYPELVRRMRVKLQELKSKS